jgi:hypothetical protein
MRRPFVQVLCECACACICKCLCASVRACASARVPVFVGRCLWSCVCDFLLLRVRVRVFVDGCVFVASVCLCFECVFGDVFETLCVFFWRTGAGGEGGRPVSFPERAVRRFALIRRRRKERSVPYRVARGTHEELTGYSRWYSPGTGQASRTESTQAVPRGPNWHGWFCPLQSLTHPSSMHSSRAHTPTPLRQTFPPVLSVLWSARVLLSAHVLWCMQVAGASLVQIDVVRACDGGTGTVHVEVEWHWRALPCA